MTPYTLAKKRNNPLTRILINQQPIIKPSLVRRPDPPTRTHKHTATRTWPKLSSRQMFTRAGAGWPPRFRWRYTKARERVDKGRPRRLSNFTLAARRWRPFMAARPHLRACERTLLHCPSHLIRRPWASNGVSKLECVCVWKWEEGKSRFLDCRKAKVGSLRSVDRTFEAADCWCAGVLKYWGGVRRVGTELWYTGVGMTFWGIGLLLVGSWIVVWGYFFKSLVNYKVD